MSTLSKKTKGEELFLVHLHRQEGEENDPEALDDHDYPEQRKRSRSIGEELYQVHLKRSHGLDESADVQNSPEEMKVDSSDQDLSSKAGNDEQESVTEPTQKPKPPKKASGHELHLRNRDVPVRSQ